jgi:hypothetical protein
MEGKTIFKIAAAVAVAAAAFLALGGVIGGDLLYQIASAV